MEGERSPVSLVRAAMFSTPSTFTTLPYPLEPAEPEPEEQELVEPGPVELVEPGLVDPGPVELELGEPEPVVLAREEQELVELVREEPELADQGPVQGLKSWMHKVAQEELHGTTDPITTA